MPAISRVEIARLCHEVNRAYCLAIGDTSQVAWEEAPDWQRNSALAGVNFLIDNPQATPADTHASWLRQKQEEGWEFGEVKDADKLTHPCMVPYEQLPAEQRLKDVLFLTIVRKLTD